MAAVGAGAAVVGAGYSIYSGERANRQAQSQASQANYLSTIPRYTNNGSSVTPLSGQVNIDPSVRKLQAQSLSYIPSYQNQLQSSFGQYNSGLGNILSGLQGNQNAYIQARQAPLQQQFARQSGELQQSNINRGIAGSSFGNQSLTGLNTDYGTAIGNAGALGLNDSLNAQAGLYGNMYNAGVNNVANQQTLTNAYAAAGQQNLQQELASLGLSQANIQGILGAGSLSANSNQNAMTGLGNSLSGLGSAFGGIANQQQAYQNQLAQQQWQLNTQPSGWSSSQAAAYDGG